mmetsp:Transcript_2383/g.7119  ORF Transcript_2383/g.7119 Transcript_2383/m.7119 type:complete len:98 (-) Transcript_2383:477-770(-)
MISGFVSSAATGLGIRRCRGMFGCRRVTVRCSSSVEVTREVVEKTARLAQLDFSPEELDRVTPEFKKIIGFVEQVGVETSSAAVPEKKVQLASLSRS